MAKRKTNRGKTDWAALKKGQRDDSSEIDPECPPLSDEELSEFRPVAWVKRLRLKLRLSQPEFCRLFGFNLSTLRDWEQGRSTPEQSSESYLRVIAVIPEEVQQALKSAPPPLTGTR